MPPYDPVYPLGWEKGSYSSKSHRQQSWNRQRQEELLAADRVPTLGAHAEQHAS